MTRRTFLIALQSFWALLLTGGRQASGLANLSSSAEDLLLDPPFELLYPDKPQLSAQHLSLIRKLRLSWNGTEAGAPQAEPENSFFGGNAVELIRSVTPSMDDEAVAYFMISLVPALAVFMDKSTLAPGSYELKNMSPELLQSSKEGLSDADRLFAIAPDMSIEVSTEDITLAKRAQWEWPDEDDMYLALENGNIAGPTVDPKRPYGDMSYIALDIHQALGWPVEAKTDDGNIAISDSQAEEATRLHFRQLGVMQAYLENASIDEKHVTP